jgi:hypothetical protein
MIFFVGRIWGLWQMVTDPPRIVAVVGPMHFRVFHRRIFIRSFFSPVFVSATEKSVRSPVFCCSVRIFVNKTMKLRLFGALYHGPI